jgi:predicted dehydrogenase
MTSIRVAIVGCGRISDLHALGYEGRTDAVIAAVCDKNRSRAAAKARRWSVERVYDHYSDVLLDDSIDLVELLVPHDLHASMTIAACRAGKHVSVQKPMALTVSEANSMIDAARDAGVVLRVYENFVFYPPFVRAKQMIEEGEIGEPQMIRVHFSTGSRSGGWSVPLGAWLWRFSERRGCGGPVVFDHGYHLFSIARHLMGEVERVYAWMDRSPIVPTKYLDAPATVMFQFKSGRRYGVMDFVHAPRTRIDSLYYADDNRVEVIGDRGVLFVNRCTARTVDLPELMVFRDGETHGIPVERPEWHHSFIDCTGHLVSALQRGTRAVLDGEAGKAVLQFSLAAHESARTGREVRPDEVV